MGLSSFWNALERRRVVFDPTEIASTCLFRGAKLEALGIVVRLLPYVITGPVRYDALHRLAGVSSRKLRSHWDDIRLFLRESDTAPDHWELLEGDAVRVQILTTSRRPLRHLLPALVAFWGNACVYCGKVGELEVEHIVPRTRGGSDDLPNLTVACSTCNIQKFTKTASEFGYPAIHERAKALA